MCSIFPGETESTWTPAKHGHWRSLGADLIGFRWTTSGHSTRASIHPDCRASLQPTDGGLPDAQPGSSDGGKNSSGPVDIKIRLSASDPDRPGSVFRSIAVQGSLPDAGCSSDSHGTVPTVLQWSS